MAAVTTVVLFGRSVAPERGAQRWPIVPFPDEALSRLCPWVVVIDGHVRFESGGETIDAGPGVLAWFEADERHSVASDEGARILLLLAPWPGKGHYHADA